MAEYKIFLENSSAVCLGMKHTFIYLLLSNSTPRYIYEKNENVCLKYAFHKNVCENFIHNNQRLEIIHRALNRIMDKQTVVYIMEQKSNKRKEQITDISNMGESQKHHSEWKKSDAKKYMLRKSIYMESS